MKKIIAPLLSLFIISNLSGQNLNIDSMKNLLRTTMDDTARINLLNQIAEPSQWNVPDTAIKYAMEAWQLALKSKSPEKLIQEPAGTLSEALSAKGNYSKALSIALHALQMADKESISGNYFEIGNVYFYSGNYSKALEYYFNTYKNLNANDNFYEIVLGVIGESYYHLNNLDSALYFINKAYQLDKSRKRHWSVPYFYMAFIHSKKGAYNEALEYFRSGLHYAEENKLFLDIVNGSNGISDVFKKMHNSDSAIYYARQALTVAQSQSLNPGVMKASGLLTELFLKINTDSAFKYQRIMLAIKDSLFSEEKIRQLENITFNEKMQQEEKLQAQKAYQNKLRMYGLIAGLFVILLVAFMLYRNNQHKQKAYNLLKLQKQEIDYQKAEVEKTLEQLKSTQSQLIQSEKMASLGELTAGIAHEIQNPLNFVNNFSDINTELIGEADQEIDKGNVAEVKDILNDIRANEEKINHHGKRADAIVKGMLQHSRTSTGPKEPTDINALCDEYLRLAYHGMRAKDKSFNCEMKTDFDSTLPKINVLPQDIGRVILNLINNAFYACAERKNLEGFENLQGLTPYLPTVTVSTKNLGDKVEISVKDNGNGIPEKIKDKIFQPFFTTKPTGQGTGLGLSLSYDIVKSHGGNIKVESLHADQTGTEFIIQLPLKENI